MAKDEGAFTKVPNWILDDTSLNTFEFRIMLVIARQTIGYGKKSDGISISQFSNATGISISKVKMVIKNLKSKKLIRVQRQVKEDGGKSYNRYSLTPP